MTNQTVPEEYISDLTLKALPLVTDESEGEGAGASFRYSLDTVPYGTIIKAGVEANTLAAKDGKGIFIAADTNLETWAGTFPLGGAYTIQLTVAQGALEVGRWHIEFRRASTDGVGTQYQVIQARSMATVAANIIKQNTYIQGTGWSGWEKIPVAKALVWTVPSFINSWVDYAGSFPCRYSQADDGTVWVKGFVKSGSNAASTTVFTLPAGLRPLSILPLISATSGGAGEVRIDTSGNVQFMGAISHTGDANAYLSLQIVFKGEQ